MKILKYIILILAFLVFISESLVAKTVTVEKEKIESFSGKDFKEKSAEKEWLGLLYIK